MRRLSLGIVAAAAAAGAALAQPSAGPPAEGRKAPPPGGYTQLFISPCGEPWRAGRMDPYPVSLWFAATDTNHDGAIDKAEFRADHLGFFDALDRDGNGFVEGAEITFYEQRIAPDALSGRPIGALDARPPGANLWGGEIIRAQVGNMGKGQVFNPGGASGPPADLGARRLPKQALSGGSGFGFFNDAEPVTATDSNLDGRVSRKEFQDAADRRFARLDRNQDGKLTPEELPRTRAQIEGAGTDHPRN